MLCALVSLFVHANSNTAQIATQIPLSRILLETDAPWCDIRADHAGAAFVKTTLPSHPKEKFVKGQCVQRRNEPAHIVQVCEVLAAAKDMEVHELAETAFQNTRKMFKFRADPTMLAEDSPNCSRGTS